MTVTNRSVAPHRQPSTRGEGQPSALVPRSAVRPPPPVGCPHQTAIHGTPLLRKASALVFHEWGNRDRFSASRASKNCPRRKASCGNFRSLPLTPASRPLPLRVSLFRFCEKVGFLTFCGRPLLVRGHLGRCELDLGNAKPRLANSLGQLLALRGNGAEIPHHLHFGGHPGQPTIFQIQILHFSSCHSRIVTRRR